MLPITGKHPEKYSSLFEMRAETLVLALLREDDNGKRNLIKLMETVSQLVDEGSKESKDKAQGIVRQWLAEELNNLMGKGVVDVNKLLLDETGKYAKLMGIDPNNKWVQRALVEARKPNGRQYFGEVKYQIAQVDFKADLSPEGVNPSVFQAYTREMTEAKIPKEEHSNFDVPENVYYVWMTFGEVAFQMRKVVNELIKLKEGGVRLPNEIVILTEGRKSGALESLWGKLEKIVGKTVGHGHIDDSLRQFNGFDPQKMAQIHALRKGAKRAEEKPDEKHIVQMEADKIKKSEILRTMGGMLDRARSTKGDGTDMV